MFTQTKKSHIAKLEDFLKALLKNELKISPRKCQLFRKELQYTGNTIFPRERRVCVKPLRSRLEAIQKLIPQLWWKVVGVLQTSLIFSVYFDLNCKNYQHKYVISAEKETAYFVLKTTQHFWRNQRWLQEPPVFHLPDNKGRLHLYSGTSKVARGSALYEIQHHKPKLLEYISK